KTIPLKHYHWFLLFLGLLQVHMSAIIAVMAWFVVLDLRKKKADIKGSYKFNLRQLFILGLTFMAVISFMGGIGSGLLGSPDMRIQGFMSYGHTLSWYQDISSEILPTPWVFSLPVMAYRMLMLVWALWLAFAMIGWIKWAWKCYSEGGHWRKIEKKVSKKADEKETE
ncbi:MAG: hypothetical protein KAJ75_02525, partial [Alphaproteobacteria bacterium]|nr:hypothetical protein [Alphaproteobacteria bacterium]